MGWDGEETGVRQKEVKIGGRERKSLCPLQKTPLQNLEWKPRFPSPTFLGCQLVAVKPTGKVSYPLLLLSTEDNGLLLLSVTHGMFTLEMLQQHSHSCTTATEGVLHRCRKSTSSRGRS